MILLAAVGAVALAFMFAVLSRRIPAEGGPLVSMAGGAALLGIPVYLSQRSTMTEPAPVTGYK